MSNKPSNSFNSSLADTIIVFLVIAVLFVPIPLTGTNIAGMLMNIALQELAEQADKFGLSPSFDNQDNVSFKNN